MDYLNLCYERIVKSEEFHLVGTTPESPDGMQPEYYGANRAVNAIASPLQNQSQLLFLDSHKFLAIRVIKLPHKSYFQQIMKKLLLFADSLW